MLFDSTIIQIISDYRLVAVFLGAALFGETVIISSAFLAAKGVFSLASVFSLTFLGTIVSDSIWFYFGSNIINFSRKSEKYKDYILKIEKITGNKTFLALLFIKFLYGTRILTIIYLSIKRISFIRFLIFNTLGTLIWLPVIIGIGWFAGKGLINLIPLFNRIEYILVTLVLLIVIVKMVTIWLTEKIVKG